MNSLPDEIVSTGNSPWVQRRQVEMGKLDRGDVFHTMWCCCWGWAPIIQDALTAAIRSVCIRGCTFSGGCWRRMGRKIPQSGFSEKRKKKTERHKAIRAELCSGFPRNASPPPVTAAPLSIWMKSCSCIKGPVYQSAGRAVLFFFLPLFRCSLCVTHTPEQPAYICPLL